MRKIPLLSVVALLGCAGMMTNSVRPPPSDGSAEPGSESPGGECFWSMKEGDNHCVVVIGTDTRTRDANQELIGKEGYGQFDWRCGERQEVCGLEVECTCRASRHSADGGSR